jgi:hypothetical protein
VSPVRQWRASEAARDPVGQCATPPAPSFPSPYGAHRGIGGAAYINTRSRLGLCRARGESVWKFLNAASARFESAMERLLERAAWSGPAKMAAFDGVRQLQWPIQRDTSVSGAEADTLEPTMPPLLEGGRRCGTPVKSLQSRCACSPLYPTSATGLASQRPPIRATHTG